MGIQNRCTVIGRCSTGPVTLREGGGPDQSRQLAAWAEVYVILVMRNRDR